MREIIFRGKRTDNGEWVEGGYAIHKETGRGFILVVGIDDIGPITYMQEVIPETISSITKINNTKFGVGDIIEVNVSFDNPNERGTIKFGEFDDGNPDEAYTGFYVEWRGRCSEFWRKSIRWWTINHSLKVIGNIYDNPELLK